MDEGEKFKILERNLMGFDFAIRRALHAMGLDLRPLHKVAGGNLNLLQLATDVLSFKSKADLLLQMGAFESIQLDPIASLAIEHFSHVVLVKSQPEAASLLSGCHSNTARKSSQRIAIIEAAIEETNGEVVLCANSKISPKASLDSNHMQWLISTVIAKK